MLLDDDGLVLTLTGVSRDNTVSYPKAFHIGFILPSDLDVDAIYQRIKDDGFAVESPSQQHGAWAFSSPEPCSAVQVSIMATVRADSLRAMRRRTQPIFDRIFGVKPGSDAPRLDRLLWFRGYYLRWLPLTAFVMALGLVLVAWSPWVVAVLALPWLYGFARLNVQIHHEQRGRHR
jgi:hypothetical protein